MRILYYISFKYVVFCCLRCLRDLEKWSKVEKIGKNGGKMRKIAVLESAIIHYLCLSEIYRKALCNCAFYVLCEQL